MLAGTMLGLLTINPAAAQDVEEAEAKADAAAATATVRYATDVRPILSDACFACHGPDEAARKADLRLDQKEEAFRDRGGYAAIVPGDPELSELIYRISTNDEFDRMPPESHGRQLTEEEIATITAWVEQGAVWEDHWAFRPLQKPEPPEVSNPDWPRNEIDRFILERLDAEGLSPAPEADRATLIRRLSLDLTGLPPTPEEVDAFRSDDSPDAYENLVDRLLDSPRYGEHQARYWLDAARYGDTHGLHLDNYREMWPYRDWVVDAFNRNLGYDRFIIEQLAGDLLPEPSLDQRIATGFNRAHVTTNEGGSIKEEVYVRNVVERVEGTGTAFLGLTIGCARCHDHKYDPITMEDFYGLFAYFNSLDGDPMDGNAKAHPPVVKVPSPEQKAELAKADERLARIRSQIAEAIQAVDYDPAQDADRGEYIQRRDYIWIDDALPPGAKVSNADSESTDWPFVSGPDHPVHTGERSHVRAAVGLSQHYFTEARNPLVVGEGDTLFTYVFLSPIDPPKAIMLQWNTGEWKHRAYWGENAIPYGEDGTTEKVAMGPLPTTGEWVRLEVPIKIVGLKPGDEITGWAFTQHGGTAHWDTAGLRTWTPQPGRTYESIAAWIRDQKLLGDDAKLPGDLKTLVDTPRSERSEQDWKRLRNYFVEHGYEATRPTFEPLHQELAEARDAKKAIEDAIPTTLVWKEREEPKPAFVLERGEYDQKGDPVERHVPDFLLPPDAEPPKDRLELAKWIASESNPLTSRVAVNRFWQQVFGTGLVKTSEDFGSQGDPPSHPDLLNWLAVQFIEDGWDVKRLMKRIVMSSTYRQSSRATPEKLKADPNNRLLARGPRFRLDAETIRDQALFVSGLLVETMGGPSVKPPQPEGLWYAVGYTSSNTARFEPHEGRDKVHRRSVYTFWKRTSPPPQLKIFDAPTRESCVMRRERTNTPLQALLLLNDPQYVEAARALAERVLRETGPGDEDRIAYLFRLCAARPPDSEERRVLLETLANVRATYEHDEDAARELIAVGEVPPDPALEPATLASWTMVANTVLNLDEVINKN